MRLLRFELKKLFASRGVWLLIIAFLTASTLLCLFSGSLTEGSKPTEEYIASYESGIQYVIRVAKLNLADFSASGSAYILDYQENVIDLYTALLDKGTAPEVIKGYDEFVLFSGGNLILLLLAVLLGARLSLCEKDAGVLPLLGTLKSGRRVYSAKLTLLAATSISVNFIAFLFNIIAISVKYSFRGLFAPVQSVQVLAFCPYPISIAAYIGILFAVSTLLFFLFAVLAALIGKFSDSYLLSLFGGSLPFLLFVLFDFNINTFFERYRAVNLFGVAADHVIFWGVLLCLALLALCLLFSFVGRFSSIFGEKIRSLETAFVKKLSALGEKCHTRKKDRPHKRHSLYFFEFKKIFLSSGLIFLVLILLAAKGYMGVKALPDPDPYEVEYRRLCEEFAGEYTEAKNTEIVNRIREYDDILGKQEQMLSQMINDEISREEYDAYMAQYNAAAPKRAALSTLDTQRKHLQSLYVQGITGEFFYDTGWQKLLFTDVDLLLYALVLFSFVGIYSFESASKMDLLLPTLKNGKKSLHLAKFAAALSATAVFVLIFSALDLCFAAESYPITDGNVSAISLVGVANVPQTISLVGYFLLLLLKKLFGFLLFAALVCTASKLLKRPLLILPIILALTLLPKLLWQELPVFFDFTMLLGLAGA